MYRVLLINMPFAAVEYPSLALGLFKTRLINEGIPCDVEYLNIRFAEMIGWQTYIDLIVRPPAFFAAEQLFAHSLFGDKIPGDSEYYADSDIPLDAQYRLQGIKTQVIPFLYYCLEGIPWASYEIIGFTSLFEQNLSSLALAYQVKQRYPNKIIVFGGPNFEATMGLTFHRCLPFIDYVCSGEADNTFPELINRLTYGHPVSDLPGLVYRDNGESVYTGKAPTIYDLDSLSTPNYDEYFQQLRNSSLISSVDPCVLLETSRGCWWGEKSHCTFCGLNSQSMKFRSKSAQRCLNEILYLVQRYSAGFIRVVDNILDPSYFEDLLPEIARMKLNTQIFYEVKANLQKDQIKILSEAGVSIIQAGIESLNTHVLKLMRKGSTALINVQTLKWCKQFHVKCDWNMIYGFPGEVPEDYMQCAEVTNLLTHMDPPTGCGPIRLDRFSPNFNDAEDMGFTNVRPLRSYRYLYPFDTETLFNLAYYFDFDYKEEVNDGGYLPLLSEAVWRCKNREDKLYTQSVADLLVIYDSRPVATLPQMVLTDIHRYIYEYCDKIRSIRQIEQWLREMCQVIMSHDQIKAILDEFIENKLMIREGDRYLSLAIMTYTSEFELMEKISPPNLLKKV